MSTASEIHNLINGSWDNNGSSVLTQLRERRRVVALAVNEIRSKSSNMPASDAREMRHAADTGAEYLQRVDERITELEAKEVREANLARHYVESGMAGGYENQTRAGGEQVYTPTRRDSFFRDLANCRRGDWAAAERLHRNNELQTTETRALGNTGGVGGSGGEFAPPAYLLDQFVELARPARVTADLATSAELPPNVSSIVIPKVLTGTTEAVQTTQNTAVSQTDLTTGSLSSPVTTIAGKQIVSQQLLDQSGVSFDQVIFRDLAHAAAQQLDLQVLNGTGAGGQLLGVLNVAGLNAVTYTNATPAVVGVGQFLQRLTFAINSIQMARFLPPTAIVMHPRRWNWVLEAVDSQNRPLVTPDGPAFNAPGTLGSLNAQGAVGTLQGLPVYLDPNLPTNLGAGTNQDPAIVARFEDLFLWETPPVAASFDAPYADSMAVLLRLHLYCAFLPQRYPAAIAVINGTGMVAPTL